MKFRNNNEVAQATKKHVAETYGRYPIALVRGEGTEVWDRSGNRYLDFVAGLAVNNLGHCHPAVVKAIRLQAGQLIHVSNLYHIEPQSLLAEELTRKCFADKFFFCNSGTEANEAAIKLARKYFYDRGEKRREIITLSQSFHGRTMASLSATAQKKFQKGFAPLLPGFKYVEFNNLRALKKAMSTKTCAVLIEPVQGEGGVNIADKAYMKAVKQLCRKTGALLIFDEVQTAFGRTGTLFAYEHFGVKPDIITLAKALGGGFPIGAMGATSKVMQSFVPGTHAATFGGNPLACAAALASLKVVSQKRTLNHVKSMGNYFIKKLNALAKKYPVIVNVRGMGLMVAAELSGPGAKIVDDCMKQGFLINCIQGNTLRFIPPLTVTQKQINQVIGALDHSFERYGS
ncbi:MAG: acetylornithine transaminase [Candidatus Nitrohelix vancouverensis]|uniref:Acetylornithine aminotransferase n=1 Tax=Candidatus Nitrohelix vancouverensis TaxID=2705534 RepID=A0A7T0G4Z8_9BACT|nr:MAG: acetylornithine transaminase [Candidatus Nitrohelix vancouverensis]